MNQYERERRHIHIIGTIIVFCAACGKSEQIEAGNMLDVTRAQRKASEAHYKCYEPRQTHERSTRPHRVHHADRSVA